MRMTIACAEALIGDANALMSALGDGPADGHTFGSVGWSDPSGGRYALASWRVDESFVARMRAPLAAPSWPCDMAAAVRAQARLVFETAAVAQGIAVVFDPAPRSAIQHLGLASLDTPED